MRCPWLLVFSLVGIVSVLAPAADQTSQSQSYFNRSKVDNFILEKDVAIAMRDGVILRADVLRPRHRGRFPTLVYRTPYNKEEALKDYSIFRHAIARGYA